MSQAPNQPAAAGGDRVAWARRINSRWIVHHGLRETAAAYLAHLEQTDQDRLRRACEHAYRLVHLAPPMTDPKPWFYAGLFAEAGAAEARQFLTEHWFIATVLNPGDPAWPGGLPPEELSDATREKIAALRHALAGLRQE